MLTLKQARTTTAMCCDCSRQGRATVRVTLPHLGVLHALETNLVEGISACSL